MANLFDPAHAPTVEPTTVTKGDFIQWRRVDIADAYPFADYILRYVARISPGAFEVKVTGTDYQNGFLFTITSATSATFLPGFYYWQLEAEQKVGGNKVVISRGSFTVKADLDDNTADPRSHAVIMLAKIKSLLEGKADADVANYSIAGRSLTKLSFDELIKARDYYQEEVNKELIHDRIAKKQPTGATVKVRFL